MSQRTWIIVFAALVANTATISSLVFLTQSLFMGPMLEEFGWSQTAYLAPMSAALVGSAVLTPAIGFAIDRYGVRVVMLPLLVAFGLATTGLALATNNYLGYCLLIVLVGVTSVAQSPLLYGRIVAGWATEQRGLALSVALSGLAIGNLLWPPLAGLLIEDHGWRWGRAVLGLSIFVIALPIVWFLLPEPPPVGDRPTAQARVQSANSAEMWLSRHFWQITLVVFLGSMALGGYAATLALILKPRGISMAEAAGALSALALAQIVGRLLSGRLLDAIPNAAIGSIWMLFAATGIVVVNTANSFAMALLGGALLGLGAGALLTMAAYFVTRFFSLAAFGRIYGLIMAAFIAGNACGPLLLGLVHDLTGNYTAASMTLLGASLAAAALIMTLGPYRFAAQEKAA